MNVKELLKIAGAPNNAMSRAALDNCLEAARVEVEHAKQEKEVPAALFGKLDKSIRQTLTLLERLQNYSAWRDICFGMYVSGAGTAVAVSTKDLFEGKLTLPRTPPPSTKAKWRDVPTLEADGTAIGINLIAALRDVHETIVRCAPKAKQGQPEKVDKAASVHFAKKFFDAYSRYKASTDPKNRFAEFCEHFYTAVNGRTVETDSLAWFIRAALKSPRGLRWKSQLHDLKKV
jgi:hypothetical protein